MPDKVCLLVCVVCTTACIGSNHCREVDTVMGAVYAGYSLHTVILTLRKLRSISVTRCYNVRFRLARYSF